MVVHFDLYFMFECSSYTIHIAMVHWCIQQNAVRCRFPFQCTLAPVQSSILACQAWNGKQNKIETFFTSAPIFRCCTLKIYLIGISARSRKSQKLVYHSTLLSSLLFTVMTFFPWFWNSVSLWTVLLFYYTVLCCILIVVYSVQHVYKGRYLFSQFFFTIQANKIN